MNQYKKLKMLVMDVDGTLTDGRMYMTSTGEQIKGFDAKDGCGIKILLPMLNIIPAVITAHDTLCVTARMEQLNVKEVHQGVIDKLAKLDELRERLGLAYDEIAVIGDDLNDRKLFEACGVTACPKDACDTIKALADTVLRRKGGRGAVREFIDLIQEKREENIKED